MIVVSEFFYRTHDPTTKDRQGNDSGKRERTSSHLLLSECDYKLLPEYRSAIFYHSPAQEKTAKEVTEKVQKEHFDPNETKIVTQIVAAGEWGDAEDYHQLYLFKNPTGYQCATHRLHW